VTAPSERLMIRELCYFSRLVRDFDAIRRF